jgi:hypothetical protein
VLLDWSILLGNCLLKHVVEENTEEMRRGERGLQQLLDFIKEKRKDLNLKEKALDCSRWRTRFGTDCGPIAKRTKK